MRFDLHVHSDFSACSNLGIEEIVASCSEKGLDGVCITDHDTMKVSTVLSEGIQENGVCVIFGMEYATRDGDFLIFGPFENIEANLSGMELLTLVKKQGGAAIAAHPFRQDRSINESLVRTGQCRLVERTNGRNNIFENEQVAAWSRKYSVAEVGGSDAHSSEELGKVVTKFFQPVSCRQDLISALKQERFLLESEASYELNGPLLETDLERHDTSALSCFK